MKRLTDKDLEYIQQKLDEYSELRFSATPDRKTARALNHARKNVLIHFIPRLLEEIRILKAKKKL